MNFSFRNKELEKLYTTGKSKKLKLSNDIIEKFFARIQQIEAAEIDGASKFQIFKSITFPQILLIMAPSLIQQFIGNINNFNVIYFLTGGGPTNSEYYQAGSTDLLVTWLYKLTVSAKDYNLASVIGILIFAISATFSLLAYTRSSSFKEGAAK